MRFAFHELCHHSGFIRVVGHEHLRIVFVSWRFSDAFGLLASRICLDRSTGNNFPAAVF